LQLFELLDSQTDYCAVTTETYEIPLLKRYYEDLKRIRIQMMMLQQRRDALAAAVSGLEGILRVQGVDVEAIRVAANLGKQQEAVVSRTTPLPPGTTTPNVVGAVVAVLTAAKEPLGAKAIQQALRNRGIIANYHTLYKLLKREAIRTNGVIADFGEKIGLREWATNDSGADRRT
jgi:hypothetical protein